MLYLTHICHSCSSRHKHFLTDVPRNHNVNCFFYICWYWLPVFIGSIMFLICFCYFVSLTIKTLIQLRNCYIVLLNIWIIQSISKMKRKCLKHSHAHRERRWHTRREGPSRHRNSWIVGEGFEKSELKWPKCSRSQMSHSSTSRESSTAPEDTHTGMLFF